ncbi:hypothetical protein E0485_16460 [Paenibacillus albiflavus]|uniref:DUF4181 domain-containing protein n=1 Tax=Paenibacillus albiflavus TaxID=2545760 RepID=A0A4R4EC19_9BACL|nr:hypothetical protein [Paenibacillus albiflavus]TCZ75691.1 hypothetical protein E0485_16460 [Paenibacillus albiflavus]
MIFSSILIFYSVISLIGSIALLHKGSVTSHHSKRSFSAQLSIYFFMISHSSLLAAAVYQLNKPINFIWFIGCFTICIISRWLNGQVLFGKSNWHHYFIVGAIFGAASVCKIYL